MMTYIPLGVVACLPLLRSVAAAPAPYMHFGALGTVTVTVTLPCSASAALPSGSPSPPLFHAANFVADVSSSSLPAVSSASFVAPNPSSVSGSVAAPSASVIDPSAPFASGAIGSASVPAASSAAPSASVNAVNPAVSPGASSIDNQDVISLATSLDNLAYSLDNNADSATLSTVVGTLLGNFEQLLDSLINSSAGMTSVQTKHLNNALAKALESLATTGSLPPGVDALIKQLTGSFNRLTSTGVASSTGRLARTIATLLHNLLNGSVSASASVV